MHFLHGEVILSAGSLLSRESETEFFCALVLHTTMGIAVLSTGEKLKRCISQVKPSDQTPGATDACDNVNAAPDKRNRKEIERLQHNFNENSAENCAPAVLAGWLLGNYIRGLGFTGWQHTY